MTAVGPTPDDPFGPHNLPWCVYQLSDDIAIGVRLGDHVFNVTAAEQAGLIDAGGALNAKSLNPYLAQGRTVWTAVRRRLIELLTDERQRDAVEHLLIPLSDVELRRPFEVGDYVDFYSSEHHAANVGRILRPGQPPVLPNWRHLPIGYHGRAGTVVVSGTPVTRPWGQTPSPDGPVFRPSARLDIEAELGFVVGPPSELAEPVSIQDFEAHVFGVVIVNDWSARDIQAWEYQPLGPFLGKSFATSISPWVVELAALEPARVPAPAQDPEVVAYLREADRFTYRIELEVRLNATVVSRPPFDTMYWTPAQQLAHLTVNGASLRTGDLFASGTISGPAPEQWGSLLELTRGGAEPLTLADGSTRAFLEDGDTVIIEATAIGANGTVIGMGAVAGTIMPARALS